VWWWSVHLGTQLSKAVIFTATIVNVATRIEGLADPGGLVISDGIHEHIRGRLGIDFVDGGNREVKNIERALPSGPGRRRQPRPPAVGGLQPPRDAIE
jgi:adenylate cyclase